MTGIMDRIRGLFVANAHDSVDQLENPAIMSRQILRELGDDIDRSRQGLVKAVAAERELEHRLAELGKETERLESRARVLLDKDQEAEAREIVARQLARQRDAYAVAQHLTRARTASKRLRTQLERLQQERNEARSRSNLIALTSRSQDALRVAGACNDSFSTAMHRRDRLDEYARRVGVDDFEAEAAAELQAAEDEGHDAVDLSLREQDIDEAMARLRASSTTPTTAEPNNE